MLDKLLITGANGNLGSICRQHLGHQAKTVRVSARKGLGEAGPKGFSEESMAHQGWDSLTVDIQHGVVDYQAALTMLTAISSTDTGLMASERGAPCGVVGQRVHSRHASLTRSFGDRPDAPPDTRFVPLDGYTFQGFRNCDGSVGTRSILTFTNTVQCVSGVVGGAVDRIRCEMLPRFPNVGDVIALDHTYGCGVAIDAPDAAIPIRTLHNNSRNPNFAGSTMIVASAARNFSRRDFSRKCSGPEPAVTTRRVW